MTGSLHGPSTMRREEAISILRGFIPALRRNFGVRRIALIGSTARDEAREDSDPDLLVDFEIGPTFDAFIGLKFFLEAASAEKWTSSRSTRRNPRAPCRRARGRGCRLASITTLAHRLNTTRVEHLAGRLSAEGKPEPMSLPPGHRDVGVREAGCEQQWVVGALAKENLDYVLGDGDTRRGLDEVAEEMSNRRWH
jgi:predicted nucleotidyltransferase